MLLDFFTALFHSLLTELSLFWYCRSGTLSGCVFTSTIVSLNIPEGVLFTDFVKRLKNDWCFHE